MKYLILSALTLIAPLAQANPAVIKALKEEVPELKDNSVKLYKRIYSGFEFKGYSSSPGHQAILAEMRNHFQNLKAFESRMKEATSTFPEKSYKTLIKSQERVDELVTYVLIDEEVKGLIDSWSEASADLVAKKEELEKLVNEDKAKMEKELADKKLDSGASLTKSEIDRYNAEFYRRAAEVNAIYGGNNVRREFFTPVERFGFSNRNRFFFSNRSSFPIIKKGFSTSGFNRTTNRSVNRSFNRPIIKVKF